LGRQNGSIVLLQNLDDTLCHFKKPAGGSVSAEGGQRSFICGSGMRIGASGEENWIAKPRQKVTYEFSVSSAAVRLNVPRRRECSSRLGQMEH
jgi:hypothetical protein